MHQEVTLGVAPFEENVVVIDGVADAVTRSEVRSAKCEPSAIGGELERLVRIGSATSVPAASIAAIEQWQWTPARLDCVPIDASLTVTVEFRFAP